MPFRYRIFAFGPTEEADPQKLLTDICRSGAGFSQPSASSQWADLVAHIARLGGQSLLVQSKVRDPDFLEEYEAFYSKQHREMSRFCVRVHAFARPLPVHGATDDRSTVLSYVDEAAEHPATYLGFITLRPLRHAPIGASILVDSPEAPSLCKDRFPVHIAGTTFEVVGTPYLQQDNAVGACAQASIWMALRTLRRRSGNSAYSPAELTLAATRYMSLDRVFPGRQGLTVEQMLSAIRASDHDPLVITVAAKGKPANPYEVMANAQPYIESGLPVVTVLDHPTGGHAVVAIGLRPGRPMNNFPPGLIIHNDNAGPYRVLPFSEKDGGYALNQCASLIIPLPQGVLMSAEEAERQASNLLDFWLHAFIADPADAARGSRKDLWARTYLCTRHAFRKWAKRSTQLDAAAKDVYRTAEMPRFIWVTEIHDEGQFEPGNPAKRSRLGEIVLDAAADALHGDALIFLRVAEEMVKPKAKFPGLLVIGGEAVVPLATSVLSEGIAEPWDHI